MKKAGLFLILTILLMILTACSGPVDNISTYTGDDNPNTPIPQTLRDQDEIFTVLLQDFIYINIDGYGNVPAMFIKLVGDLGTVFYSYCADINLPCHQGYQYKIASANEYFRAEKADEIMAAVSYLRNKSGELETANPVQYGAILQSVIWCIIHDYNVTSDSNPVVRDAVEYVLNNLDNLTDQWKNGVTIEGTGTASRAGDYILYGPYNISSYEILADCVFDLTFSSGGDNAVFVNPEGNEITKIKSGQRFYVKVPADASGEFKFISTVSADREFWFAGDYYLFINVEDIDRQPLYQPLFLPLFLPLFDPEMEEYHYSGSAGFMIESQNPPPVPGQSYCSVTATNAGNRPAIISGLNPKNNKPYCGDKKAKNTPFVMPNTDHFVYAVLDRDALAEGIDLEMMVGCKFDIVGTGSVRLVGSNLEIFIYGKGTFGAMAFNQLPALKNGDIHCGKADFACGSLTKWKADLKVDNSTVTIPCPAGNTIWLYINGDFRFYR